jgi:hypothetical protein
LCAAGTVNLAASETHIPRAAIAFVEYGREVGRRIRWTSDGSRQGSGKRDESHHNPLSDQVTLKAQKSFRSETLHGSVMDTIHHFGSGANMNNA